MLVGVQVAQRERMDLLTVVADTRSRVALVPELIRVRHDDWVVSLVECVRSLAHSVPVAVAFCCEEQKN